MGEAENKEHDLGHEIGLGITILRGLMLIVLGLSLLLIPDKTYRMLVNAMGIYWLMTGIVLIRRHAHARGNRLLLAAAIAAVLTGLLVLGRGVSRQWLAEVWVKGLLGGVILLNGILHATAQSRFGRGALRGRPLVNVLLGLIEIVLGVLVLVTPTGREPIVFSIAIVWSLLAGGFLLVGAVVQWLQERRQQRLDQAAEQLSLIHI